MNDDEYEVTIGTGGWVLVVVSGIVTFVVLRWLMGFLLFPAVVFGIAIALIVVLLLYWLAGKVSGAEGDEARKVRKIVPASSEVRLDGAIVPAVMAVPVRPESLKSRGAASVVTPLSAVESAPIIAAPAMPVSTPVTAPQVAEVAASPKAKAAVKPKAGDQPKVEKAEPKPKAPAKAKVGNADAKPEPKPKVAKPKAEKPVGLVRLKAPRKGRADDLQEIEGIGPALEKLVNGMGFYHFDQIAAWTAADVATVDAEMKTFKGRIARDRWVEQARII
ncbi:MAG: hypothetical protein EON48_14885, partial [Acetobacteraceae bacterium]